MQLTNLITLALAALATAAPMIPSTGPMKVADVNVDVGILRRNGFTNFFKNIGDLVKPLKAPGNKKGSKRDLLDIDVGADIGLAGGEIKRSSIEDLFKSIGGLVKPLDAPGNTVEESKRHLLDVGVEADAVVEAEANVHVKRDLLDVEVGLDGGLGAAVVRRSSIENLFKSIGGLVKPLDAPGNTSKGQ